MSKQTPVPLEFEGEELEGVFVGRRDGQARPTVILIPTVMGVSELAIGFGNWFGHEHQPHGMAEDREPRGDAHGFVVSAAGEYQD